MRRAPWATYLWPGLAGLWLAGSWRALATALAAAALVDTLVLGTLVWVEWIDARAVGLGWMLAIGLWIGAAVALHRSETKRLQQAREAAERDLFRQAQGEYLRGDHYAAEATLEQQLTYDPRDAEARLLLATLYRHTHRVAEATEQLNELSKLETAARWQIEIAHERTLLNGNVKTENTQAAA